MTTRTLFLLCAALSIGAPSHGQEPLTRGTRVRVTNAAGDQIVGVVRQWNEDDLMLDRGMVRSGIAIARSEIALLERSVSRRRGGKPVALSLGAGAVLGLVVGSRMDLCDPSGWFDCMLEPTTRGGALKLGFFGGALVGAVPGIIIALAVRGETWESTPLPYRPLDELSVRPIVGPRVGFVATWSLGELPGLPR